MLASVFVALGTVGAARQAGTGTVQVVSAVTSVQAGHPFKVGILLEPAPGWHTYWMNSGDSGTPTSVEWHLPPGWRSGPVQFPAPERIVTGGIVSYGYEKATMLVDTLTPPAKLATHGRLALKGRVRWLTCTPQICKVAKGDFALSVPAAKNAAPDPTWHARLQQAESRMPAPLAGRSVSARLQEGEVVLSVAGPTLLDKPGKPYFFPGETGMISHSKPQTYSFGPNGMVARLPLSEDSSKPPTRLIGVLEAPQGDRIAGEGNAVYIDVPIVNAQERSSQENKHE